MRCTECNYPLWNTPAGNCPECGSHFRPSEHAFHVGEVLFRCPDCAQDYYGDDIDGHLRPNEFDCVKCERHLHEDDCLLFPAEGDMDTVAEIRVPWMDSSRGRFRRWMGTAGWSMTSPGKLIETVPLSGSSFSGWKFCLCNIAAVFLIGYLPFALLYVIPLMNRGMIGMSEFMTVLWPIWMVIVLLLQALLSHGFLLITGGKTNGFSRTMSACTFSTGPFLLSAIPCAGSCLSPVSFIWYVISSIIMLQVGHKVSGVRAVFSGLLMPFLLIAFWVGGVMYSFYQTQQRFGNMAQAVQFNAIADVQEDKIIANLLADYSSTEVLPTSNVISVDMQAFITGPNAIGTPGGKFQEGTFDTEWAKGWWWGPVFVCTESTNPSTVTILIWSEGRMTYALKNGQSLSRGNRQGVYWEELIEAIQADRVSAGEPAIPKKPLQDWADSLAN